MAKADFEKIDVKTLVTVLVHGGNELGFRLAKTLVDQGSRVIILDEYNSSSKKYISELKKLGKVDFIDIDGITNFYDTIGRIDYLLYLHYDFLLENDVMNSREFLNESNNLDLSLKSALKYNSKFALVNTIKLNKLLALEAADQKYSKPSPYTSTELQKYAESLVAEYHDKSNANARIVRLGYMIGENPIDLDYDEELKDIFYEAVQSSTVNIHGEGLNIHYLINTEDALFGILKLIFASDTNGEVISLCNDAEYTTLAIAYKILELDPNASEIKFVEKGAKNKLMHDFYVPADNASNFGWKQKYTLEQTVIQTLDEIYEEAGEEWKKPVEEKNIRERLEAISRGEKIDSRTKEIRDVTESEGVRTLKTPLGRFIDKIKFNLKKIIYSEESDYERFSWGKFTKFFGLSTFFFLLFYFILGPLLAIAINLGMIYLRKDELANGIKNYQFESVTDDLAATSRNVENITSNIKRVEWIFTVINKEDVYTNYENFAYSIELGAKGAEKGVKGLAPLAQYIREFEPAVNFEGESTGAYAREYREYLTELDNNQEIINKASYDIILAGNLLEDVEVDLFPGFVQDEVGKIKSLGVDNAEKVEELGPIVNFLPELLGIQERQRYLFLLQNPSELRSTGGWISSYAILGVEGGQIRELEVEDIYNLDGLLKTQNKNYTAPQEMQDALDLENWNTSLSNWSPDFITVANSAEFFVKESGKVYELDGVIAVNVTFIQDLLEVWNGVEVPISNENSTAFDTTRTELVTKENMYDKIFEMHKAYQPGDTRKADFLASLSNVVFQKILSSELSEANKITDVLVGSLDEKDILIYIKEREVNQYVNRNDWGGDLKEEYKGAPVKVEWNWGANKANLFLSKQSNLEMEVINEDEIRYTYSVVIQNNSVTNIYPEGDYENYMRLYLPENAYVTSVRGFQNNDYESYFANDFKVVGGWFNVPVQNTQSFEINYMLKRTSGEQFPVEVVGDKIRLDFEHYKQPGDLNHQFSLDLFYPENWALEDSGTSMDDGGLIPVSANHLSGEWPVESDLGYNFVWVWK